jgi:hypothetical protein
LIRDLTAAISGEIMVVATPTVIADEFIEIAFTRTSVRSRFALARVRKT